MSREAITAFLILGLATTGIANSATTAACPEHLLFLKSKCAQWQSYVLPPSLPAARGNAFADNEAAAVLGMKIFYDNRFSKSGSGVACANCHDPEHAFAERKPTSHTIRQVARNAPDLINAPWYKKAHFWDGKVDNLWSAPLFTFEQDDEMGASRLQVVHTLASIYKARYEKIFGPLPDLSDTRRFPEEGKPGMPRYDAMTEQDKKLVNQVFVNVGKALEAYVRKLAAGRSPFDDFISGSSQSIGSDARRGMVAFTRHGCDSCHSGPTFTDEGFHDLGYRPARSATSAPATDPARAGGMAFASKWPFSSTSQFADPMKSDSTVRAANIADDIRGFRTPSLRNLKLSDPYGHDGIFTTLESAIDAHAQVLPEHSALAPEDNRDIVAFLRTLNGRPPQRPWNYWPGG